MKLLGIARDVSVGAIALCLVAAGPAVAVDFTPGSAGLGDPYFPLAGNGGYDVAHYSLVFSYDPATRQFDGTATVTATATQNLSRFDLDLRGFDDRSADRERHGRLVHPGRPGVGDHAGGGAARRRGLHRRGRLRRHPVGRHRPGRVDRGLGADRRRRVRGRRAAGVPGVVSGQRQSAGQGDVRLHRHRPGRDHGDGERRARLADDGRWPDHMGVAGRPSPMAPYLATATLGRFDLTQFTAPGGIPSYVAVDPTLPTGNVLRKLPDIVEFYASIYGPYPFEAVGAIVDNAPDVGYSLETQTKPVFDRMPDEATLAHEISHMWYGDSVTLTEWPDIWLHEGFATWSEWIWSEHLGQKSAHNYFKTLYNTPAKDTAFWTPPPGDPGSAAFLFNGTIYNRGGMTLQALREKIGDGDFFEIMRRWAAEHRYGNVRTPQFVALAEQFGKKNKVGKSTKVLNQLETPEYLEIMKLTRAWFKAGYINKDAATTERICPKPVKHLCGRRA